MSGGHGAQSDTPQRYNGMQIGSSSYGGAVPILYGRQRVTFTLIWYNNFQSKPVTSNAGKGGGGQQTSSYNYSASFAAALVEGPIADVVTVFQDKDITTLAAQGLTLFNGAGGQATWTYLVNNFPAQAIPYDHTCYVGAINFNLGGSAALPNLTFEIDGFLGVPPITTVNALGSMSQGLTSVNLASPWALSTGPYLVTFSDNETFFCNFINGSVAVAFTSPLIQTVTSAMIVGGAYDSDPSQFMPDYITDLNHGMGLPSTFVADLVANGLHTYYKALGFYLSPYENTQRQASDFIAEILQICNSDAVWTGSGQLTFLPYADQPVTGNGVTYTPNVTPLFSFDDDDYLIRGADEPVKLTRKSTANTYNHVKVEYLDRSNSYNTAIAEASDEDDINKNGERVMDTLSFHEITNAATARLVAQLILQVVLYERNTVSFSVRADYGVLEPMDYIEITDTVLAYDEQLFRVTKVNITPTREVEIEAMEIPGGVRTAPLYQWQAVQGYNANYGVAPGSIRNATFMEASGTFVDPTGGRELYIGVAAPSGSTNWGGCQLWMSFDNVTYAQIGTITSQSATGALISNLPAGTTDPDTTNVLDIFLDNTALPMISGTTADADNNRILMVIDPGLTLQEILSYASVSLVGAGHYHVTYMHRGQYGTVNNQHFAGSRFMLLNGDTTVLPIDPGWIGQTLFFKFTSFNLVGRATESLASVPAYTFTPTSGAVAYNSSSQSTFSAGGNGVVYSPTTAFKRPNNSGAWDSSVYTVQGYTNGCSAECYPSKTNLALMLGLTLNPTVSNSYTNLAYAWYMTGSGSQLQIYENGVMVTGNFGTYSDSDLLAITHDGKHVSYWHNGVLVRTVTQATTTFFMQICFFSDNASVYGMAFSSNISAIAPFTLVPMSNNVAASGTRAVPNLVDINSEWGARNFQSKESYSTGCQISFDVNAPVGNQNLGLTLTPTTGSLGNWIAAWQFTSINAFNLIFNGSNLGQFGTSIVASDVFTITYDQFWFRWWRNGALLHQEYQPNVGALYLYGDFYDPLLVNNSAFLNISFEPYGQVSPNPFIATGTAVTHDSVMLKDGPGTAWDSNVYSLNGYTTCHAQAKAANGSGVCMFGLSITPAKAVDYTNIDYAIYTDGGTLAIYESGTAVIPVVGPYLTTDLLVVTYDGSNVRYYQNSTLIRSVAAAGLTLFYNSSYYNYPSGYSSVSFGPGITLDTVPTAGMDANAASQLLSTALTTEVDVALAHASGGYTPNSTVLTGTVTTTGFPVGVDVSSTFVVALERASLNSPLTVYVTRDGAQIGTAQFDVYDFTQNTTGSGGGTGAGISWSTQITLSVVDTPPAGVHTYGLTISGAAATLTAGQTSAGVGFTNTILKIREYKR